ncbi:MAG: hypothetical protein KAJ14_01440, partial [Candidatus Omnitrophica bacterium]|nr:hypothetical protein [Candidatus Omnitrophota bacterium]
KLLKYLTANGSKKSCGMLRRLVGNSNEILKINEEALAALGYAASKKSKCAVKVIEDISDNLIESIPVLKVGSLRIEVIDALANAVKGGSDKVAEKLEANIPVLEGLFKEPTSNTWDKIAVMKALVNMHLKGKENASVSLKKIISFIEDNLSNYSAEGFSRRELFNILASLMGEIKGPELDLSQKFYPSIAMNKILNKVDFPANPRFVSRKIIYDLGTSDILVIKFARENESPLNLLKEVKAWDYLAELKRNNCFKDLRFDIAEVLKFSSKSVVQLKDIPINIPENIAISKERYCICFVVNKDYFCYFNELSSDLIAKEVFFRSFYLLGYLAALGIPYKDVISLFHNMIEGDSRHDNGVYLWGYGGRITQWLSSCDFSNIGMTGIRDLEHSVFLGKEKIPFYPKGKYLLSYIMGGNVVSMLLLAGSYFRSKDKNRRGVDINGKPVDTRDLFDPALLKEFIVGGFLYFYEGFMKRPYIKGECQDLKELTRRFNEYAGGVSFDLENLTNAIIEKMGVDNHMKEVLRREDQKNMSNEAFIELLITGGYANSEMASFEKGKKDIIILTGPHLGRFDGEISLPEIIDAAEWIVSLCMLGKF